MKTIPSSEAFRRRMKHEDGSIVMPRTVQEEPEDETVAALKAIATKLDGLKSADTSAMQAAVSELSKQTAMLAQMVLDQAKAIKEMGRPKIIGPMTIKVERRDEDGYAREYVVERNNADNS